MTLAARLTLGWLRRWVLLAALIAAPASYARDIAPQPEAGRTLLVLLKQVPRHYRPGGGYGGNYGDAMRRAARDRIGRKLARTYNLSLTGAWPMPLLGLDCLVMTVPASVSIEEVAAAVSKDSHVSWAEPMHRYEMLGGQFGHNDPLFAAQPVATVWHLAEMHRLATGKGSVVAVIDTRIDVGHPDLVGQVSVTKNFVADQSSRAEMHGTAVAGIIAARAGNGLGMAGVAPRARIMGLRACWQLPGAAGSACDTLSLAKALHHAIERNVSVVNLSLGGPPDRLLGRLIDVGVARGMAFVAAYDPKRAEGGFPASHAGVFAVADEAMAGLPRGVYRAPGRDLPTTQPGGGWHLVNGSSYSAAHVSGLLALLRERRTAPGGQLPLLVSEAGGRGDINVRATLLKSYKP